MAWPVTGAREGQASSSVPVGPGVLARRHASREDRAWLAQRWAPWQAVLAKAKTDRWAAGGRGQQSPRGCGCP